MDDSERIIKELQKLNEEIKDISSCVKFLTVIALIFAIVGGGLILWRL
ncbi:hypothetical protein [Candidatus Binatus sp.]